MTCHVTRMPPTVLCVTRLFQRIIDMYAATRDDERRRREKVRNNNNLLSAACAV